MIYSVIFDYVEKSGVSKEVKAICAGFKFDLCFGLRPISLNPF